MPGKIFVSKCGYKLSFIENLFFPSATGMLLFTFVAYILSWIKIPLFIILLIFISSIIAIKYKYWMFPKIKKEEIKPLVFIISLAVVFSLTMILSGQFGNETRLIDINSRDSLWHLALINELKVHFPPDNPGFSGIPLKGYHFFYNFLLAQLSNIFQLSPFSLYFQLFPLFIALLWGFGVYSLIYKWSGRKSAGLWAVFLTFFGGSFSFILRLQGHKGLSLDDAFGMTQPASSLVNPPFAISIIIILTTLFSLYNYLQSKKAEQLLPAIFGVGLAAMFKVYAGIILIGGFTFFTVLELFKKRIVALVSLIPIAVLFFSTYWIFTGSAAFLIWFPLWAPHSVLTSNMPWYGYTEKQYTYSKLSVIRGLIEIELYGLRVFILGSLGTRLVGLLFIPFFLWYKKKLPSLFSVILLSMGLISLLIPLFFIQSIKVFEITQMTWYFLFFSALFASFGFSILFDLRFNKIFKIVLFLIVLFVTLPSAYEKLSQYISFSDSKSLTDSYYASARFLRNQGNYEATVLEMPGKHVTYQENDLRRWYKDESSPGLLAFSNKRGYLNNEYIDFPGTYIESRINLISKVIIFNNTPLEDPSFKKLAREIESTFKREKISYIYSYYPLNSITAIKNIKKIYHNQDITIYQMDKK